MNLNEVTNMDCFTFMKSLPSASVNLIYTDTPYNMGARYYIDKEGHYCFAGKGSDFMNRWQAMDGRWWDKFFQEAYRILKPGGFFLTHNIDRQSDLWTYYARRNKFFPMQKLYWLFIDNFPKGVDVALQLDNLQGVKRDVIGKRKGAQSSSTGKYGSWGSSENENGQGDSSTSNTTASVYDKTVATSELAQKYDGYKYGQAALKQVMEEILVFNKELDSELGTGRSIMLFEDRSNRKIPEGLHPPIFNVAGTLVRPDRINKRVSKELWTPQLIIDNRVRRSMVEHMTHEDAAALIAPMAKVDFLREELVPYSFSRKPNTKERNAGLPYDNPHPTPKPLELCKWVLKLFTIPDKEKMIVYDPFCGQGSIPVACQMMGLNWMATEITKEFIEVANYKLQYYSKKQDDEPDFFQ